MGSTIFSIYLNYSEAKIIYAVIQHRLKVQYNPFYKLPNKRVFNDLADIYKLEKHDY